MSWISEQLGDLIEREDVERYVSKCGHVVIDGRCHEYLKGRLTHHDLEQMEMANEEAVKARLVQLGFDLSLPIETDRDVFTGASTYCQLRPARCDEAGRGEHDLSTIEGLRQWMKEGCPTG